VDSHTETRELTGRFGYNVLTVLRRKIKCHEDEEYYTVTSDVICARCKISSKVEVDHKNVGSMDKDIAEFPRE
jgi:hypothetical protein